MNLDHITLTRIDPIAEREDLIDFITGNHWPFHVTPQMSREQIEKAIESGAYRSDERDSYWVDHADLGRIGLIRFEDLEDDTPVFDLRLASRYRGRGLGVQVLKVATAWVFEHMPATRRFEGQTRDDNLPMRRTFVKAGWVKEAYYRQGWPVTGAEPRDSVAYAILRSDWESGTSTPVPWGQD
ncbi:GNAT family N-acetyltransferase [Rothia sp. CCM 9417]|uniref:GNAT family N-acetyltransferase n=1 Tax=unclassified Rothia (in: high G+C Gram-positive bacteria) TaxID=2689056 RepID=UPI003AE5C191